MSPSATAPRVARSGSRGEFLLLLASGARVADGFIAGAVAIAGATIFYGHLATIGVAMAVTLAAAFLADLRSRIIGSELIGHDPSTPSTPIVLSAVSEAARAAGMRPSAIYPRYLNERHRQMKGAFAASALRTQRGSVVFYGDAFRDRALDVIRAGTSQGDKRFAFDELRAVIGHELAHLIPGTGASSRILSIPFRFSMWFPWVLFWTDATAQNPKVAVAGVGVTAFFKFVAARNENAKPFYGLASFVAAVAVTTTHHGHFALLAAYLLWPKLRPITAMFWQRKIETACDEVAVDNGADPYALSRSLERFEPEQARYVNIPLWQALQSSHPPLRKRILSLDSKTRTRR